MHVESLLLSRRVKFASRDRPSFLNPFEISEAESDIKIH